MKQFKFNASFDIDFEKERSRIRECFDDDKPAMEQQLKLVDLFENQDFLEWERAYDGLPYSSKDECPEQEYVGLIFHDIVNAIGFQKYKVEKFWIE